MGKRNVRADRLIAELAERQHGVVARGQLLSAGVGARAIDHRLDRARLCKIHRGVYAVGHRRLTVDGRWTGAVLAAGAGAVLSHRAAAALWGIRRSERLEVSRCRPRRSLPGVTVHQSTLADDETTVVRGIPVTSVSRTLLDLAGILPARHLESAMNEAEVRRLTDQLSLADLVRRYPGRRGVATIRAALAISNFGAAVTRSELESHFRAFVTDYALPIPEFNLVLPIAGRVVECDCVWRRQRLMVELDGWAVHATRHAFERDRSRDRSLHAAGWRIVRVTWRQLHEEPWHVAADLRLLLR